MSANFIPDDSTKNMPETRHGVPYDDCSKAIVNNVLQVCKEEKKLGRLQIPLSAPYERAVMYSGASIASLYRFQKESSEPPSTMLQRRDKFDLDDFHLAVLRRTVQEQLLQQKILPTAKTLKVALQEKIGFLGSDKDIRRSLKKLGFKWRKSESNT